MKAASILETIGDTPHIRINRLYAHRPQVDVWMKSVLTFCYDTGERYLSVEGLFDSDATAVQVGAANSEGQDAAHA